MNTKIMEGLIGANINSSMADIPMKVYKAASCKGDTATMNRAAGYANECVETAEKYQKKVDEGMQEEAKEIREQKKLDQKKAMEKRKEERKQLDAGIEKNKAEKVDTVEISEAGRVMLETAASGNVANTQKEKINTDMEPIPDVKIGKED